MKKFITITAAILSFGLATKAQSTSSAAPQRVTLSVDDILDLSWSNGAGTAQIFSFSNLNDYTDGKESNEQEFRIISNKNFKIEVKTTTANLTDGGSNQMPVLNHLKMMVTSNTTGAISGGFGTGFTSLNSVPQQIISGGQPGNMSTPEQKFRIKYKAVPGTTFPKAS